MEIFVFMSWRDSRLDFSKTGNETIGQFYVLTKSADLKKLWQPPVFFSNTKSASRPKVINDNAQMVLLNDGSILVETRSVRQEKNIICHVL